MIEILKDCKICLEDYGFQADVGSSQILPAGEISACYADSA